MKANELRIGNYYDNNGDLKVVTPNTILEVWESQRAWCQEIPLTEEWLLRFGFKNLSQGYWYKGLIQVGYTTTDEFIQYEYLTGINGSQTEMLDLKYVHQLQNLYFALSGNELTIQE